MVTAVIALVALMGVGVMGHNPSGRSVGGLRRWLDECGLHRISVGTIAVALAVLAVTVAAIVSVLVPIPVLAPLAGVAGLAIPIATLDAARTRRRVLAESRWPDVIDAIRMAIRSGVPLHEALESVVAQVPTDWRVAWNDATSSLARGASVANALMRLRATLAEPIADRVCESIIIATEMGGTELPRVLEELARSTREEIRIRREATSRQSWVRHAARLGAAAPWLVVVLLGSRPENRTAFTSAAGVSLLVACAGATVVAYIVMTAMGRLPEARRWVRDD